jgi:hypothetical protein
VRIQSMNGVNLDLFQFEFDLTWMGFFMDAEDRFYARYGGREDTGPESHLNKQSLLATMRHVLDLHRQRKTQTSRYEPTGKGGRTPEDIPTMGPMMARRKENKCIHCHDVKVASLRHLQAMEKFSRDMVFTYPTPSSAGIELDPIEQNRVRRVVAGSAADRAGVLQGDRVAAVDGQRVITLGDFSRVLELTPAEAALPIEVERAGDRVPLTLRLAGNWRRSGDPAWRESLHVAGPNGGFWGQKLSASEREASKLAADILAVKVTYIWGDHTRKAGLSNGDVIVEWDGKRTDMTINQLHAHLNLNRNYGESVDVVVLRDGRERKLRLQLPAAPTSD